MSSAQTAKERVQISVQNIGGIEETTVEFRPGITSLTGRNATNRTSLLQAIMAALGSEDASLKGDADEGSVELTIGDTTYTRILRRTNGTVVTEGNPYLDDAELAELFAFLLESNDARRAVAQNENLRELIMRPVDTEAIQAEIEQFETEKRELDQDLEKLQSLEGELPDLERKRTQLANEIETKRQAVESKEEELEDVDVNVEETRTEKAELDKKLEDLREVRSSLEDVRFNLNAEQESIEALREEKHELEDELETLPGIPVGEIDDLDAQIDHHRKEIQKLDATISELQTIIQFNEEMLEGTSSEVIEALREDDGADTTGSITDQLVDNGGVTCWTCGCKVSTQQIEETLNRLRSLRQEKLEERNTLKAEIADLESDKRDLEKKQRRREQTKRKLRNTETEIEDREETIEDLENRQENLVTQVKTLESEVEELEMEEYSDILDLHKEANQLEFELDRLQGEREEINKEIQSIENQLDEREEIKTRRREIQSQLEDLRTRIDQIEAEAVEQFNEHMDTVLDLLDYENLERVWIERTERETREGRRTATKRTFDLHVIRHTEAGGAYEDTIDHLSESEREVTGLVFALAGYLVHDVHEEVPFILLDSVEAIDAERIAALVEYFSDYATYLVIALLPEDAAFLDDTYQRVTDI